MEVNANDVEAFQQRQKANTEISGGARHQQRRLHRSHQCFGGLAG
jgi:hypothetical protein